MFGRPPPWSRDPIPDIHSLLNMRSHHHPPRDRSSYATYPRPRPDRALPGLPPRRQSGHKAPKQAYLDNLDTPSTSDLSSSEWDYEPYSLDTDDERDRYRVPRFPSPRGRYAGRAFESTLDLDTRSVTVRLRSETAEGVRRDEILLLPTLTHLHVRVRSYTGDEEDFCAAVPESMRFGDVVEQVAAMCFGHSVRGVDVRACVKQRGRWDEPSPSTKMGELAHRGEVFRHARRELDVKIEVGDGGREGVTVRPGGRGPRGSGFDVKRVVEREVNEVRGTAGAY